MGGAAADIHHHVAGGLGNGEPGADGGHHGLLDEVNFAGFSAIRRIHDRALFDLRDLRGHADHDARVHQHFAVVGLLDEVIEHSLGYFEVGDDAAFHRLDGENMPGATA